VATKSPTLSECASIFRGKMSKIRHFSFGFSQNKFEMLLNLCCEIDNFSLRIYLCFSFGVCGCNQSTLDSIIVFKNEKRIRLGKDFECKDFEIDVRRSYFCLLDFIFFDDRQSFFDSGRFDRGEI